LGGIVEASENLLSVPSELSGLIALAHLFGRLRKRMASGWGKEKIRENRNFCE